MSEGIRVPEARARTVLDQWRSALLERVETVWRRYRSYPTGTPLLDIHRTISTAGWGGQGRPRLVAAPVTDVVVLATWTAPLLSLKAQQKTLEILMPPRNDGTEPLQDFTVVPAGDEKGGLGLMVLWEPDWELKTSRKAPILLQHLDGPIYVVVRQHELTALERKAVRS